MQEEDDRGDDNSHLDDIPACPYGEKCYRKNPEHFLLYSHPPALRRSDTWPSSNPSTPPPPSSSVLPKIPSSAPASLSSQPITSTPFINLVDDSGQASPAIKKRKIEQDIHAEEKEKLRAETGLKIQQLTEKHTQQLHELLAQHVQEVQALTKSHSNELLEMMSLSNVIDVDLPVCLLETANGLHTPRDNRSSKRTESFSDIKKQLNYDSTMNGSSQKTYTTTSTRTTPTPPKYNNSNTNNNYTNNNNGHSSSTKSTPQKVNKSPFIAMNDDYEDDNDNYNDNDHDKDSPSQLWSKYPCSENLKPKGRLSTGAIGTGTVGGKLSDEQKKILEAAVQGTSLFYTGPAGTGKSFMLEHLVNALKAAKKTIYLTAPTGVAASNIGGITIHSYAGVGLGDNDEEKLFFQVKNSPVARDNWINTDVLVIDEISMLSGVLFDKLNYIAKRIRGNDAPFGGIQLILVGDFFQLSPIHDKVKQFVEDSEELENRGDSSKKQKPYVSQKRAQFCFETQSWAETIKEMYQLTKVFRQGDEKVVKMLSDISK